MQRTEKDLRDLAVAYIEDGAYHSAKRIVNELISRRG